MGLQRMNTDAGAVGKKVRNDQAAGFECSVNLHQHRGLRKQQVQPEGSGKKAEHQAKMGCLPGRG